MIPPPAPVLDSDLPVLAVLFPGRHYQPKAVVARCHRGYPGVVLGFHPAGPGGPGETLSTTLHWVACPWLESRIQALENGGWLDHLRWILAHPETSGLRDRLSEAAREYTSAVRAAHDERSPGTFGTRNGERIMGIGGTRDPLGLKCLHNHAAWFLAGGDSPIGALVMGLVELDTSRAGTGALDCGGDCVATPTVFGLRARRV